LKSFDFCKDLDFGLSGVGDPNNSVSF
jgi:hypothetical protein